MEPSHIVLHASNYIQHNLHLVSIAITIFELHFMPLYEVIFSSDDM